MLFGASYKPNKVLLYRHIQLRFRRRI